MDEKITTPPTTAERLGNTLQGSWQNFVDAMGPAYFAMAEKDREMAVFAKGVWAAKSEDGLAELVAYIDTGKLPAKLQEIRDAMKATAHLDALTPGGSILVPRPPKRLK